MTTSNAYDQAVTSKHPGFPDDETEQVELSALIQESLGHPLDSDTFQELFSIQNDLRSLQRELAGLLEVGTISREGYLTRVEDALKTSMFRNYTVLGTDRFNAIFGEDALSGGSLIDRDIFLGLETDNKNA